MAGLLGDATDPQSLATWNLVAGLLSPGSFGQGLGKGIAGYQGALANGQDMQLKQQQIVTAQQEQQLRDVQIRRAQQQLALGDFFGGAPSAPTAPAGMPATVGAATGQSFMPGSGAATPQQNGANMAAANAPTQPLTVSAPERSKLESLTQDQIAKGVISGVLPKELVELWTNSKFGRALPPGWKQDLNGTMTYIPDPTKAITVGPNGNVMPMAGGLETLGAVAAATKAGETQGANRQTLVPLDRLDRMPNVSPNSSVDDILQAGKPMPVPAGFPSNVPPNQQQAVLADARNRGVSSFSVNGAPVRLTGAPQLSAPTQSLPTTFKTPADLAAEKVIAENQAKLQTQPALTSADANATNVQSSDKAYADDLNKKVLEGFDLKRRNAEITQQMNDYRTGIASGETRTKIASNLINLFPGDERVHALADSINGGSVPSAQTFNNLVAGAMITNAIQVLQGQGRLNKAEVQKFSEAAENSATDPGALKRIMAIQNKFADQDFTEQQSRAAAIKAGNYDPRTWQADMAATKFKGMNTPGSVYTPATDTTAPPSATLRFNPSTGKLEAVK